MPQRVKVHTDDPNVQQIADGVNGMLPEGIIERLRQVLGLAPTAAAAQPAPTDNSDFIIRPQAPRKATMQPFDVNPINQRARAEEQRVRGKT